jgi:hypothetical protein
MRKLSVLAIVVALVATLPVFAAGDMTVGKFVKQFAAKKGLNASDERIASDSLAAVGIRLPSGLDYSKSLTEADVAAVARSAGLAVSTSRPSRDFNSEQVDQFFMTFSSELGPGAGDGGNTVHNGETPGGSSGNAPGNGPPFDPYSKGKGGSKGKKKGHRSATEPE